MDERRHVTADSITVEMWREMAEILNRTLAQNRSRIPTRKRQRLDEVATKKHSPGATIIFYRHPRFIQLVENSSGHLFLGNKKITDNDLIDKHYVESFEYMHFSAVELKDEIETFLFLYDCLCRPDPESGKAMSPGRLSRWVVKHLTGIYKRVFNLPPYLGGVGAEATVREPRSPFGAFAQFVLDALDIRTHNKSRFSMHTIKNLMPPGNIKASLLADEPELIVARNALVPKRGRGRPAGAI